jgi:serine/threonine protein kinase
MTTEPGVAWALSQGYAIKKQLGQGMFGNTYLVEKAGHQYTLKTPLDPAADRDATILASEADVLARVAKECGNHFLCFVQRYPADGPKVLALLSEYAPGIPLDTKRQGYPTNFVGPALSLNDLDTIARDMLSALTALESLNVAHRDIKPANIVYGAGATLIDFGFATTRDSKVFSGSPLFVSPRLYEINRSGVKIFPIADLIKSDIYALGITLYQLANTNNDIFKYTKDKKGLPIFDLKSYKKSTFGALGTTASGRTAVSLNNLIDNMIMNYDKFTAQDLLTSWIVPSGYKLLAGGAGAGNTYGRSGDSVTSGPGGSIYRYTQAGFEPSLHQNVFVIPTGVLVTLDYLLNNQHQSLTVKHTAIFDLNGDNPTATIDNRKYKVFVVTNNKRRRYYLRIEI